MTCDKLKSTQIPKMTHIFGHVIGVTEYYLKSKVDAVLVELKQKLHDAEMAKDDAEAANTEYRADIAALKAENERLNNALDKERSETIKYMDELCNAKNESERLTIDTRNAELRADVADATIVELKAKLQDHCIHCPVKEQEDDVVSDLKAKLEDVEASAYADSIDAGMENYMLRRALWLARAERAKTEYNHWILIWHCELNNHLFFINKTRYKNMAKVDRLHYPWEWRDIWGEVERKCRAKAEEYK